MQQTDGWTEMQWVRRATAVAAVACKNWIEIVWLDLYGYVLVVLTLQSQH